MKRKAAILVGALFAVAVVTKFLLTAPTPDAARPISVSFVGFSNALPFLGAPEEVRGLRAVFQVTNHTATRIAYRSEVDGSQVKSNGSTGGMASYELPANGTGTFMVSTQNGSNGWTFLVVSSGWRPRPSWQHRVGELSKRVGGSPVFVGPERTYPKVTNIWTTPQS